MLGVHISMTRLNAVAVNQTASSVAIGAGLLWDNVYEAPDGTGLKIVGGRALGIGVAGLALGGDSGLSLSSKSTVIWLLMSVFGGLHGFSRKMNLFGLIIDNIDPLRARAPRGRSSDDHPPRRGSLGWPQGMRYRYLIAFLCQTLNSSLRVASTTLKLYASLQWMV
jgi:hypothetical protein